MAGDQNVALMLMQVPIQHISDMENEFMAWFHVFLLDDVIEIVNGYFAGRRVRVTTCGLRYRFAGRGSMLASQSEICESIRNICRSLGDCLKCGLRGLRVARCELQLPNVEGLENSLAYAYGISMAYLCNSFVLSGIDFIFGMVLV